MTNVSPADRDDAALLAASAAGDEDAFAAFYRRHLAAITGFHLRRRARAAASAAASRSTTACSRSRCRATPVR